MNSLPLVTLHGWGMTPKVWNPQRICLSPMRFDTLALPGHYGRPPADAGIDAWVEQLATDLQQPCVLAAWSLGAILALEVARRYPSRVRRLILFGATPSFVNRMVSAERPAWTHGLDMQTMNGFIDSFKADPGATMQRFVHLQTLGGSKRRGIVHTLNRALDQPDRRNLDALAEGLRLLRDTDLRSRVNQVTQPTLLIHGEQDALMPCDAAHWLHQHMPDARLELFPACGHAPFIANPEACAALIRHELAA